MATVVSPTLTFLIRRLFYLAPAYIDIASWARSLMSVLAGLHHHTPPSFARFIDSSTVGALMRTKIVVSYPYCFTIAAYTSHFKDTGCDLGSWICILSPYINIHMHIWTCKILVIGLVQALRLGASRSDITADIKVGCGFPVESR